MGERICVEPGCHENAATRERCQRHYNKWYRSQPVVSRQLELPIGIHSLTNIDHDQRTAHCAACGPVAVVYKPRKNAYRCKNRVLEQQRAQRVRAKQRGVMRVRQRSSSPRQRQSTASGTAQTRRQKRLKRWGLTESRYAELLASQGGGCAICGSAKGGADDRSLAVDHCHDTGVIRGLLCWHCNAAIGHLRDSPELVLAAYAYLARDHSQAFWGFAPPLPATPRFTARRVTPEERLHIVALHAAGVSTKRIAAEVGRSHDTVWRIVRAASDNNSAQHSMPRA